MENGTMILYLFLNAYDKHIALHTALVRLV